MSVSVLATNLSSQTHSLQTVALAAVSVHAACYIREPAKRQQLSNVLAALNIGSTSHTRTTDGLVARCG
jgi:hypothetical protein